MSQCIRGLVGAWIVHPFEQVAKFAWFLVVSSDARDERLALSLLLFIMLEGDSVVPLNLND